MKYHELVPEKLEEKDFWKEFFQSNFFIRNKPYDKDNVLDNVLENEIKSNSQHIQYSYYAQRIKISFFI